MVEDEYDDWDEFECPECEEYPCMCHEPDDEDEDFEGVDELPDS